MSKLTASVIAFAMIAGLGAAAAQTTRTATIQPGKPARIAVVTALKKDCSLGEVGSIRVVTPPQNGSIVIRGGKLKTPGGFRCPNADTQVQALFYEPNKNFQGTDELAYETKDTDGTTQTVTLKINVTSKPAPAAPKAGGGGAVDL